MHRLFSRIRKCNLSGTRFIGPTRVCTVSRISVGSAILARLTMLEIVTARSDEGVLLVISSYQVG